MNNIRLIARLDVKSQSLVKGIQMEGLRKLGDPGEYAKRYYEQGADEIIYIDIVASLYGRNSLLEIIDHTSRDVFVPITAGGGIRSLDDAKEVLRAGADKVAVNSAAIRRPGLISEISWKFGSQCMVLSIEAKRTGDRRWEAYVDNGREKTGLDVVEWALEGCRLGAGEILLASIDRDGTMKGFDCDLVKAVSTAVSVPVIACGGAGKADDVTKVVLEGSANAVALASVLHYNDITLTDVRKQVLDAGINTRLTS
jgi:cyclase